MAWLDIAKGLRCNQNVRIKCCGTNRDASISNSNGYYYFYCFKCGSYDRSTIGNQPLSDLEFLNEPSEALPVCLPDDFTYSIPNEYTHWLLKASITADTARAAGIGWSPRYHRIILPVHSHSGELLYYQARAVHPKQLPKYRNPPISKNSLLYMAGWVHSRQRVVVCEDILSAIRVGKHMPACSILGTKTSTAQAGLLSEYKEVIYWLDPDEAGQKGNKAGCDLLSLVTSARCISSDADPKNLPDRIIRSLLGLSDNKRYTYHGCSHSTCDVQQRTVRSTEPSDTTRDIPQEYRVTT